MELPEPKPPCAFCNKPSKFSCAACTMVAYCCNTCEKKHLSEHKAVCKNLLTKLVNRVGDMVQQMFQVFSEHAFDKTIISVVNMRSRIIAYKGTSDLDTFGEPLFRFPSHLLQHIEDRRAILCVGRSEDAIAYLHDVMAHMMKGIPCSEVHEVKVQMRHPPLAIIIPGLETVDYDSFQPTTKMVLRINCSMSGKNWTIDPAGAADGIPHGALLTMHYFNNYVQGDPQVQPFGAQKQLFQGFAGLEGYAGLKFKALFLAQLHLQSGIDQWMVNARMSLQHLLRLPDEQFVGQQQHLERAVQASMAELLGSEKYRSEIRQAHRLEGHPTSSRWN